MNEESRNGHRPSTPNTGEVVDEHDVVRHWCFGKKYGVGLFE